LIWFGFRSNCVASSLIVLSPFKAANATFALKAGLWFRLGRLDIFLLLRPGKAARLGAENPPNSTVQICQATSLNTVFAT
jgi:hypothetical protein